MEITLNRDTNTIEIRVPADRVPDKLLGVLPEATTTAEGCLAWSIRFGDITRPSSSSTVKDELLGVVETLTVEDELLGVVEILVGETSSTSDKTLLAEPTKASEGEPFFIIMLNNNFPNTEALTPSSSRPIFIFADNITPPSSEVFSASTIRPISDTFGVDANPAEVLLFANPFTI
jgi:hypothetical protein